MSPPTPPLEPPPPPLPPPPPPEAAAQLPADVLEEVGWLAPPKRRLDVRNHRSRQPARGWSTRSGPIHRSDAWSRVHFTLHLMHAASMPPSKPFSAICTALLRSALVALGMFTCEQAGREHRSSACVRQAQSAVNVQSMCEPQLALAQPLRPPAVPRHARRMQRAPVCKPMLRAGSRAGPQHAQRYDSTAN